MMNLWKITSWKIPKVKNDFPCQPKNVQEEDWILLFITYYT